MVGFTEKGTRTGIMATLAKYQTIFERNGVIVPGMPVLAPGV